MRPCPSIYCCGLRRSVCTCLKVLRLSKRKVSIMLEHYYPLPNPEELTTTVNAPCFFTLTFRVMQRKRELGRIHGNLSRVPVGRDNRGKTSRKSFMTCGRADRSKSGLESRRTRQKTCRLQERSKITPFIVSKSYDTHI